jgi:Xaa-Pro aminopeptidase
MKSYYKQRVEKLIEKMVATSIDGILLIDPASVQYFTGLNLMSSERSLYSLIDINGNVVIFAPKLEVNQAKDEIKLGEIVEVPRGLKAFDAILEYVKSKGVKNLGIDSTRVSYSTAQRFTSNEIKLHDISNMVAYIRSKKDLIELENIIRAIAITERALDVAKSMIMEGIKELDIMNAIISEMINNNAEWIAFIPIVASGARSAYPHGSSSNKILRNNDLVVVDLGARVNGYCADLTRTFTVNKPDKKKEELYQIIIGAIEEALNTIAPNIKASEIDKVARQFIEKKGYGEYFTHGLGHGFGLEVHEYPTLSTLSEDILEEGQVVTIEPGIYIPGFGGIRIEEDILITRHGYQLLSRYPRDIY